MLYLVPTPIGNLGDMTQRALEVLRTADVIACEDTRRLKILLSSFNIATPQRIVTFREYHEEKAGAQIMDYLAQGLNVALCSDAGFPGISDPGYRLSSLAVEKNVPFTVLPGASAVHVALLLSGLPTSSYTFKGYPPRKPGVLRTFFNEEKDAAHTLIYYESPFRIGASLKVALEVMGDRRAAVCLELTKKFERVSRGYLSELVSQFPGDKVKGEATVVVAGNNPKFLNPVSV